MSEAGKADMATPLMHLRRRKRTAMIFLACLSLCVMTLGAIILSVNDGRNYRRLMIHLGLTDYLASPTIEPPPAPQRYRRTGRLPSSLTRVIDLPIIEPAILLRQNQLTSEERCAQLAVDGQTQPAYRSSDDEWECIFQRDFGSVPEPSVLFVQVKGETAGDRMRSFRMKLSLLDPSADALMRDATFQIIDRFSLGLSLESRSYLTGMISERREFSSLVENYRIRFERERGDEQRFNLLLIPRMLTENCDSSHPDGRGRPMQSTILLQPIGCLPL